MAIDNPQTPPDYDLTRITERSDGF